VVQTTSDAKREWSAITYRFRGPNRPAEIRHRSRAHVRKGGIVPRDEAVANGELEPLIVAEQIAIGWIKLANRSQILWRMNP